MNSPPLPTSRYSLTYPEEFQQVILEKSENFVGREFIFTAINDFLQRYKRGYFTIVGVPGSGKSAILAQYVQANPDTIYYNVQIPGKNHVEEFFKIVCSQLTEFLASLNPPQPSPTELLIENASEGSWLLSRLLQQISDKLTSEQKLIIIIDGLEAIDIYSQPPGTNLFYLPRYLPDGVYFLFSRRPDQRSLSGLLIEAPSQLIDLAGYQQENQQDIKLYIQHYLTLYPKLPAEKLVNLIRENEVNFMYVREVLQVMAEGWESEDVKMIPPGLEIYYQQHWQKIQGDNLSAVAVEMLRVFTAGEGAALSIQQISQMIDVDIYDVAEVLENWLEFFQASRIGEEFFYQLYHEHFRVWLGRKIVENNFFPNE